MPFDEDAEEDLREFRPPPDPDDRLWRHPSEVGAHPLVDPAAPAAPGITGEPRRAGPADPVASASSRGRPWGVVLVAGATGAALAGAGVLTLGANERVVDRPVISQVALNPVGSLPRSGAAALTGGVRERVAPALVALTSDGRDASPGSGVVVRDDGIVLTGAGVLGDSDPGTLVDARLGGASPVTGSVVGTDPATGIGVVDLAGDGYQTAILAPTGGLDAGDVRFAAGAAGAEDPGGDGALVGVTIGTARRGATTPAGVLDGAVTAAVATEAADVPVDLLGGPLLDGRGAVVGVTASHERSTILATPVDVARRVVDDLLTTGRADHCWLGIEGRDALPPSGGNGELRGNVEDGTAADAGRTPVVPASTEPVDSEGRALALGTDAGALVVSVAPASPADRAGLLADDVITAFDGRRVEGMADLVLALRARRPGDHAQLSLVREGDASQATVRLEQAPRRAD
ncbi:MAG TPA: PDZ domain-containing protein [Acidimicrobiales bacterium]